ncbi:unnamed protein product, partial [Polarella glacialis]
MAFAGLPMGASEPIAALLGSWPSAHGAALLRSVLPTADDLLKGAGTGQMHPSPANYSSPGKFIFRPRTGRINWRLLHSLDLDRVVREGDVDTIQAHMDNITYARFGREDMESMSDDSIVKVVQLAQLCMEFLNSLCGSSQQLLQGLSERVRIQAAQIRALEAGKRRPSGNSRRQGARRSPSRSVGRGNSAGHNRKCPHCPKRFQSEQYLHDHMLRRHSVDLFGGPPVVEQPRLTPSLGAAIVSESGTGKVSADVSEAIRIALQMQMESVQRDLKNALDAVQQDVGRVASDVHRVADDVGRMQNTPAKDSGTSTAVVVQPLRVAMRSKSGPAPDWELHDRWCAKVHFVHWARRALPDAFPEVVPSTEQVARPVVTQPFPPVAPTSTIDHEAWERRLEERMGGLLETSQKFLMSKVEEVAKAAAAAAAAATSSNDQEMQASMEQTMRQQAEVMKQCQEDVQKQLQMNASRLEKVMADAAATAAAVTQRPPAPLALQAPAPVVAPKAPPNPPPIPPKPPQPQPPPGGPQPVQQVQQPQPPLVQRPPPQIPGPSSASTGGFEGFEEALGPASPVFRKALQDGMNALGSDDEKLRFMIAMTQERTRSLKYGAVPKDLHRTWDNSLSKEDASAVAGVGASAEIKATQASLAEAPGPKVPTASKKSWFSMKSAGAKK